MRTRTLIMTMTSAVTILVMRVNGILRLNFNTFHLMHTGGQIHLLHYIHFEIFENIYSLVSL